jgi:HEAT repeat protein
VLLGAGLLLWSPAVPAQPAPGNHKGKPTSFWIQKLEDKNAAARREAATVLGGIGPKAEAAVPALLRALDDDDTQVRQEAMTALGRIGPASREAIPVLLRALRDKDTDYRVLALQALGGIGPENEAVIPALVKAFREDGQERIRSAAMRALQAIGSKAGSAVPELASSLQRKDPPTRSAAIAVLGAIGPEAVPSLVAAVRDPDAGIREAAAGALMKLGPKARDAIPGLTEIVKGNDPVVVRTTAVEVLGAIGLETLPVLIQALRDREPGPRNAAVTAITKLGPGPKTRPALGPLIELLKDELVNNVTVSCVAGFGSEAVGPLLAALKSKSSTQGLRNHSREALERMGANAKGAVPVLIEMLKDDDPFLRTAADRILQKIGADAMPALLKAIRDRDNEGPDAILGRLGATARPAIPELLKLLKDPDPLLRQRAARCLGLIGPEAREALPALREALQDRNFTVRMLAEQAVRTVEGR